MSKLDNFENWGHFSSADLVISLLLGKHAIDAVGNEVDCISGYA